jgi:hypothetical protein
MLFDYFVDVLYFAVISSSLDVSREGEEPPPFIPDVSAIEGAEIVKAELPVDQEQPGEEGAGAPDVPRGPENLVSPRFSVRGRVYRLTENAPAVARRTDVAQAVGRASLAGNLLNQMTRFQQQTGPSTPGGSRTLAEELFQTWLEEERRLSQEAAGKSAT